MNIKISSLMHMSIQSKYFIIAVIIIGSIGIWLPIAIEALVDKKVTLHSIPPNITTYFVSLLFAGSIDFFLNKIREKRSTIFGIASVFLNLTIIALLSFGIVVGAVICHISKLDYIALVFGAVGVVLSYIIWWKANITNPNFSVTAEPLGGDPDKPLQNG